MPAPTTTRAGGVWVAPVVIVEAVDEDSAEVAAAVMAEVVEEDLVVEAAMEVDTEGDD